MNHYPFFRLSIKIIIYITIIYKHQLLMHINHLHEWSSIDINRISTNRTSPFIIITSIDYQ
jgi:hypothetical protein